MIVPDLRANPPRRWNAAVDGVMWLPRMADKALAFDAGTLGRYLYGQSPVDDSFLRRAGTDYAGFLEIVRNAADDAAVLAAIEATTPGAADRLRRWSEGLARKQMWFMRILDIDDGYNPQAAWWMRALRAPANVALVPVFAVLRRMRPVKL
jgi:hypothetical protein